MTTTLSGRALIAGLAAAIEAVDSGICLVLLGFASSTDKLSCAIEAFGEAFTRKGVTSVSATV